MPEITLESLLRDVQDLERRLRAVRAENTEATLERRPVPEAWSAAEVCEHLSITWDRYRPRLRAHLEALRAGGLRGEEGGIRPGWLAGKFIAFASPAGRSKLRAPKAFRPVAGKTRAATVDTLAAEQAELLDVIEAARGQPLNRGKFPSPLTPLLRFTLGEGLLLVVRHEQRHMDQAERAVATA